MTGMVVLYMASSLVVVKTESWLVKAAIWVVATIKDVMGDALPNVSAVGARSSMLRLAKALDGL